MLQQVLVRRIIATVLLAGAIGQNTYAEENTVLKSRLQTQAETQRFEKEKKSLLSSVMDSTNIYEYLLGNPDFAKIQDMTIRLWDKHTNVRKHRTHMKDDFIQTD